MDGLTSQNVMPVDGEGLPGKALRKRWCLSFFLKAGRVEMDERWPGSLFQTLEATDENDLDLAISVFRVGTHSDNEEEDRSDRVGTYRGIRARILKPHGLCGPPRSGRSQRLLSCHALPMPPLPGGGL